MADTRTRARWRPTRTNLVAGGLVIAGLGLSELSWWFLMLVALGTFGPGLLREMGWLHDKDEFQRRAGHRAGYHAFLAGGLAAFALVAFFRSGERVVKDPQEVATLLLALMWFTWLLSSLLAYWGAQRTASRILLVFGSVWFLFTVASNVGSEWSGWAALLLHPLLTVPFFFLAWLSGRMPRLTGTLLLVASGFFFWFFGMFRGDNLGMISQGITFILFIGPLIAAGVALLGAANNNGPGDDADEVLISGP